MKIVLSSRQDLTSDNKIDTSLTRILTPETDISPDLLSGLRFIAV